MCDTSIEPVPMYVCLGHCCAQRSVAFQTHRALPCVSSFGLLSVSLVVLFPSGRGHYHVFSPSSWTVSRCINIESVDPGKICWEENKIAGLWNWEVRWVGGRIWEQSDEGWNDRMDVEVLRHSCNGMFLPHTHSKRILVTFFFVKSLGFCFFLFFISHVLSPFFPPSHPLLSFRVEQKININLLHST